MPRPHSQRSPSPCATQGLLLVLVSAALLTTAPSVAAAPETSTIPVSFYSRTAPDYRRSLNSEGKPRREYYAISYGGRLDGTVWDQTQSKKDFPMIAGVAAEYLAAQNYYFAPNVNDATLLITIHWGCTLPRDDSPFSQTVSDFSTAQSVIATIEAGEEIDGEESDSGEKVAAQLAKQAALERLAADSRFREKNNAQIARVIGYFDEMARLNRVGGFLSTDRLADLRSEIEESRYYIVLTAFDFQLAKAQQKKKVLWSTRMSICTRGNRFADHVATMIARAAPTFGTNTVRLVRDYRGEVEIGTPEVVDTDVTAPPKD